ncbi:MAG TPA: alpha/beta fold hydrolase [Blastocatellia bacterium]|nr:alpha/beta fold hydrolase [Blastocatellia bacterium]
MPQTLRIGVAPEQTTTALVYPAAQKSLAVTVLLGHGAGADQKHRFMVRFAEGLASRGIDAATFNFLYTEQGRRTPDRGDKLETCYNTVISTVLSHRQLSGNKLVIGGKSMGGRIASQVAASGTAGISGLVFLGYPLHPPGKLDQLRSKHLPGITAPMLFVQGTRDSFGTPEELGPIVKELPNASVFVIENGDHSFGVPKKHSLSQEQVYELALDEIHRWLGQFA